MRERVGFFRVRGDDAPRDTVRGSLSHRCRGERRRGLGFWANRGAVLTGGHLPPPTVPPRVRRWGGQCCVTPRQTCPRRDCFGRNLRSKTRWFAGFCNSHQVSHFATFFIDARAEISVAESRWDSHRGVAAPRPRAVPGATGRCLSIFDFLGATCAGVWLFAPWEDRRAIAPSADGARDGPWTADRPAPRGETCSRVVLLGRAFDNDPSAGSPTETLLRLLLPLNDKAQWTSRDVAGSGPPTSPRSEHFTGPFNR